MTADLGDISEWFKFAGIDIFIYKYKKKISLNEFIEFKGFA